MNQSHDYRIAIPLPIRKLVIEVLRSVVGEQEFACGRLAG